jgi:small subunit ribosomal protein S20
MPILKSALKALRRDKRRTKINKSVKTAYQNLVLKTRKEPTKENLKKTYSALDKAVKKNIIHKKKASRLKSRLAKLVKQTKTKQPAKPKQAKKTSKKAKTKALKSKK